MSNGQPGCKEGKRQDNKGHDGCCCPSLWGCRILGNPFSTPLYALSEETDAFQRFHSYGFHNALLSGTAVSDSTISRFLKDAVSPSATQRFLEEWSELNAGTGRAYLCYDSANVNCVADGVGLAEMGHAKDDPGKPQVNLEYVVRQEDGLPLIYRGYPGSIVDVERYTGMIDAVRSLGYHDIVVVRDRGYDTVTAIVRELNKIEALADGKTGRYGRRYKLTARQKAILSCLKLSENDVDEFAKNITSSYNL